MDTSNNTKPLPELGSDSYKDVLASLSELDATNSIDIDYLEANKTRTFNFSTDIDKSNPPKKSSSHTIFTKEHLPKLLSSIVFIIILVFLIIAASRL